MTDNEILALYRVRDERAIGETEKKYGTMMHSVSFRILHDRRDAEENVSSSLLTLWNTIPETEPDHFKAYVCRVTRTHAIDLYRKKARNKRVASEFCASLDELDGIVSGDDCAASEAEARELSDILARFIRGLGEREQTVFLRRYYLCEPAEEIAKRLGISRRAVYQILSRIKEDLRELLRKEGYEE